MSLHIAFDAKRLFHNFTGLGNYSRTLVQNLLQFQPEIVGHLYTPRLNSHPETKGFLAHPQVQIHTTPRRSPSAYWRSYGINKDLKHHNIQLFHGLSHEIPIGIQKTTIPSVVTIHDLIFKRYPDLFPFLDRKIYDWKFKYACQNADAVIAISESTKQDIIQYYNISPEKIQVIYQSCGAHFKQTWSSDSVQQVIEKYNLPSDFLLYVGSIIPRKNLLRIVQALAQLSPSLSPPLVVVGSGKAYKKQVLNYIEKAGLQNQVFFPDVSYQDLPVLYQQARLFLYPSIYEGFGIPILEALYAQTPVLTCSTSSLPEAGGDGAYYVPPNDTNALAGAMEQLLTDTALQEQLILGGQQHLEKFDSKKRSEQLMNLYQSLIKI